MLVAEDDRVLQRLLVNYLKNWGHDVTVAENGAEAWRLFQAETFPLILTDWMMPEMDGIELVRHIRASERPGYTYILMLTAKAQKEDLVTGMEAGADDFVTKPFDRDELRVRLRAGERILELHRQLIQSERLSGLGQMAEGIIKEAQSPIAALTNDMTTLRQEIQTSMRLLNAYKSAGSASEEAAEIEEEMNVEYLQTHIPRRFKTALEELYRLRDLLQQLGDFAQLDEGEVREVDLNYALESLLEIVHTDCRRKQLRIETDFGELPPVQAHPGKINQVFLHLLKNAIQASQPEGVIQIRTRRDAAGKAAVVEIQDQGEGIAAEHLPHIFEPFFTTRSGEGTGLGLSVSYGIVREHGGSIQAESEGGHGSLFRVILPVEA